MLDPVFRETNARRLRQVIKNLARSSKRQEYIEMINSPDFVKDDLALIEYPSDLDESGIVNYLRNHGLKSVHPAVPHIVTSLSPKVIDGSGDVASQLWDVAIGSLGSMEQQ